MIRAVAKDLPGQLRNSAARRRRDESSDPRIVPYGRPGLLVRLRLRKRRTAILVDHDELIAAIDRLVRPGGTTREPGSAPGTNGR